MRNKSSKLAKLERNRFSILTNNMEVCFICKMPASDIHEVYAGAKRQVSMENGFCIPLCRRCHNIITKNYQEDVKLRVRCQKEYEKTHTREEFLDLIHRNYIGV